jgi:DNA-binding NtrC family response regulator
MNQAGSESARDPLVATTGPEAGCGRAMERVRRLATRVAPSQLSVLILGECGTGKDVLAQHIHGHSPRAARPFVAINCAAIPESLMAAELFGHEKGAFTGAHAAGRRGLLEAADGGTVFLDEIGDMPLPMQATLLRVIETREVRPVMSLRSRIVDLRFISATNKDLRAMVEAGAFRSDLWHRLNALTLTVPPLRDRVDEILGLAEAFAKAAWRASRGGDPPILGEGARAWLLAHDWPGNIRELRNAMDRAVALVEGPEILVDHLLAGGNDERQAGRRRDAPPAASERDRILDALVVCHGNQTRAAALLGMPRRTFIARLDRYELPRPQKSFTQRANAVEALRP